MREINFRVYDRSGKEWLYFNLVSFFWDMYLMPERFRNVFAGKDIDPVSIGRELYVYPDGRRLYEGDILFSHRHWNDCKGYDWSNPFPQEGCNHRTDRYEEVDEQLIAWAGDEGNPKMDAYKLAGNIHENPDLLEEGDA